MKRIAGSIQNTIYQLGGKSGVTVKTHSSLRDKSRQLLSFLKLNLAEERKTGYFQELFERGY